MFTPEITLDDVALPKEHRELLVNTFQSYGNFQKVPQLSIVCNEATELCVLQTCKELGLNTKGIPKGLCLLFYGPSGTGRNGCMTASKGTRALCIHLIQAKQ